jgi:hypothetical protein
VSLPATEIGEDLDFFEDTALLNEDATYLAVHFFNPE